VLIVAAHGCTQLLRQFHRSLLGQHGQHEASGKTSKIQEISLMFQWHKYSKGGIREILENYMDAKSQIWVKYSKITKLCRFSVSPRTSTLISKVKALLLQRESHRRHWARPGIWPSKRSWPQLNHDPTGQRTSSHTHGEMVKLDSNRHNHWVLNPMFPNGSYASYRCICSQVRYGSELGEFPIFPYLSSISPDLPPILQQLFIKKDHKKNTRKLP
jgi:hypothetical protein